jgi:hypothetical protein
MDAYGKCKCGLTPNLKNVRFDLRGTKTWFEWCEVVFAAFEVAIDWNTMESLFTDKAASKRVIKSN